MSITDNLNADLSQRVLMRTSKMEWVRSGATSTVERKRCFRAGPQESGAVTSVVRYLPGASFPMHPHPQGEEIFVLDGVFSDSRGDHGAGVFLLNPEGFEHAPSSEDGNLILVRLRQYPNAIPSTTRSQMALDTNKLPWVVPGASSASRGPGVSEKLLYPRSWGKDEEASSASSQAAAYPERQWLEKWDSDASPSAYAVGGHGLEVFVVDGSFHDSEGRYERGDWLRLPAGSTLDGKPDALTGCILLCKSGGLKYAIPSSAD